MASKKILSILTLAAWILGIQAVATFAQHPCDTFVNTCNIPAFNAWTVNDSIANSTGQTGEPVAHTFYTMAQNPLQTNWYHWTAPQTGSIVVNTRNTNPNAAPPLYTTPYVIDTTLAVYTGSTLTTLTRIAESDDWILTEPTSCWFPRPIGESVYSSCLWMPVTAGTVYHFQIDHLTESDPLNNDFALNVYYLAPTSAEVTVSGRITDAAGRGLAQVRVTLTDEDGITRSTMTSRFGYYRIDNVPSGESYTIEAFNRKFRFANNPRLLQIFDEVTDADFVSIE